MFSACIDIYTYWCVGIFACAWMSIRVIACMSVYAVCVIQEVIILSGFEIPKKNGRDRMCWNSWPLASIEIACRKYYARSCSDSNDKRLTAVGQFAQHLATASITGASLRPQRRKLTQLIAIPLPSHTKKHISGKTPVQCPWEESDLQRTATYSACLQRSASPSNTKH